MRWETSPPSSPHLVSSISTYKFQEKDFDWSFYFSFEKSKKKSCKKKQFRYIWTLVDNIESFYGRSYNRCQVKVWRSFES